LRECTLAILSGNVAVLAGPNGAGKTTLLHLWVGLTVPTAGGVAVLGSEAASSSAAPDGDRLAAKDTPLFKNLSGAARRGRPRTG
jgi:ABC-2 type transport system ATP-binding protein